jgi:hypothetical protein
MRTLLPMMQRSLLIPNDSLIMIIMAGRGNHSGGCGVVHTLTICILVLMEVEKNLHLGLASD